jgi:hypothetical protein
MKDPTEGSKQAEDTKPVDLLGQLVRSFDEEELRTLCYSLGIDYDNLPASGKLAKARELLKFLQRRDQLPKLITLCQKERPKISWTSLVVENPVENSPTTTSTSGETIDTSSNNQEINNHSILSGKILSLQRVNQVLSLGNILILLVLTHSCLPIIASYFLDAIALFIFIFQIKKISENRLLTIFLSILLPMLLLTFVVVNDSCTQGIKPTLYPLTVFTEPSNVEVYIDDEAVGHEGTFQLPAGTHQILIRKEGYREKQEIVIIPAKNLLVITLEKLTP